MKLQFAFGNPRRRKGAKKKVAKGKKKIAKKSKRAKTKRVSSRMIRARRGQMTARRRAETAAKKSSLSRKLKRAVQMARRKHRRSGKRKNPALQMAYKVKDGKKKLVGTTKFLLKHEYEKKIENDPSVKRFKKMLAKSKDAGEKSMLANKIIKLKKIKAQKYITDIAAKQKYMQRLAEEGAEIKSFITKEGSKVAKKKKKKGGKKAAKKATKKASSKRKGGKRKSRKGKRRSKAQKAALRKMLAAAKKARKAKKGGKRRSRKGKKRRYPKMVAHKHAKSTRHIRKGSTAKVSARKKKGSYRISTHFGKGKKRVRMTGRLRASKSGLKGSFKINPFRRNPLKNIAAQTKKYMGLDAAELTSLALGGALVPIANGLVGKYAPKVASTISQYVGPQAAGSVLPILAGVALNAVAEHGVKSGAGHEYLKKAGEGLAAAGVIGLTMSLAQQYLSPMIGLSGMGIMPTLNGINYTPMRGINYTPSMRGINYTPSMRGMGIMPQLNGVDFGAANYGGDGGSREASTQASDFGAWQSSDSEFQSDEDNNYSSSMN